MEPTDKPGAALSPPNPYEVPALILKLDVIEEKRKRERRKM